MRMSESSRPRRFLILNRTGAGNPRRPHANRRGAQRGRTGRTQPHAATRYLPASVFRTMHTARAHALSIPRPSAERAAASLRTLIRGSASDAGLRRRVWGLALPAIGEQVLALGVGVSDTFLAGHLSRAAIAQVGYGQATAITAVGVASSAVWICLTAFFAVNVGVTAIVARATGAKDSVLASRSAGQGILLGLLIGGLMVIGAVPLASVITAALGVTGQISALAAGYIRVFSFALPATGAASAATAAMRGAGDARRPLLVMLVVNGCNIVGSWTLMNGLSVIGLPAIGVMGSACGAAAGWVFGAVLAIFLLTREHPRAPRIFRSSLRPSKTIARRILDIGLPSAGELVVFQIGIVTFNRFVVDLGASIYAANTTINTVESLGSLPAFGFAVATTALVGQALGAADPQLAIRATWTALRPCLMVTGAIGLLALALPHLLLGIFVADPRVIAAGNFAMRFSVLTIPAAGIAFVFNGALRGAGDTRFPVIVRASGTWGIRVPIALLLIPALALPGARIAMALDFCTQATISYLRFKGGRWSRARV